MQIRHDCSPPTSVKVLTCTNEIKYNVDLLENQAPKQIEPESPDDVGRQHQVVVSNDISSTDHVSDVILTLVVLSHDGAIHAEYRFAKHTQLKTAKLGPAGGMMSTFGDDVRLDNMLLSGQRYVPMFKHFVKLLTLLRHNRRPNVDFLSARNSNSTSVGAEMLVSLTALR